MKRRVLAVAGPIVLGVLFVTLGASGARAASPAPAPVVAHDLREQIHREGWGRVLVHLRTPAAPAHVPEGALKSLAAVSMQRADIATAQGDVLTRLGGKDHRIAHRYKSVPYLALEVGPDALRELEAAHLHVARIVEDQILWPALSQSVPLIQADQVRARGYDGTGTVIAMIDTGVELSHQFVRGKVVDEACFSSGTYPLCPGGSTHEIGPGTGLMCVLTNRCEHGTMTSGVAAGSGAGAGVSFSGVARGAKIASYQVFSGFDCGQEVPCIGAYESDLMAALERVLSLRTTHNFAAVNMSLSGGRFTASCDDDPLKPVIDNLRSFGIATVVAVGNDAWRDAIGFPACISSTVSVGSTSKTGVIDPFYTNASPLMTLFAPGNSIRTSWIDEMFAEIFPLFVEASGTSLAAPHVAGAMAVLRQAMPLASVSDLVAALQATGIPVTDTRSGGTVTKPLVQVEAALDRLLGPTGPLLSKLTPDNAVAGGPAFTLTAEGGNFVSGSTLLVNGDPRPTTFVSATRLTASIPASDIASLATASVSVRNPDGRVSNAVALPISAGPCLTGEYFAEYFSNETLSPPVTRTACERPANEWEPFIRANWGTASPAGLPVDNFSVRWTGRFLFGESDYLFRAFVTDIANEARIHVDGALVLDVVQARVGFQTATVHLTAGVHEVKIEFQERGGGAGLKAEWFHLTPPQPAVTNLVPAIVTGGGPAFTLTAEGTGFRPGATLFWNGVAQPTTVASDTRLSASIPAVAIATPGHAWITVRNADGQRNFGQSLAIADPAATAPTLTALTPDAVTAGDPGFMMLVDGTKFASGATVLWAGAARPTTFVSATRLTASIPAADVQYSNDFQVSVRNPDGQASNAIVFRIAPRPRPAPTLTALTPNTAAAGSSGFSLTVDGTNFVEGDAAVYWHGAFRVTRFVSSTRVTADIPASDLAVAGTFPVDVRPGSGQASNRLNFSVTGGSSAPVTTALTPSSTMEAGPPFTLTVDGGNFVAGATVLWNGAPRTTTFVNANRLTASITGADVAAAGSAAVSVRNPDLRVSNAQTFTITAAPALVVSFSSPDEGATVTGTATITMSETGANGTPITFTLTIDGTQVGSSTGTLTGWIYNWDTSAYTAGSHTLVVTVRDAVGRTATATRHATVMGPPTTTALTPASAAAGGPAFTLTVDGANFVSGATVLWNGAAHATTYVGAGRVTAAISAADIATTGSASVTVRNPDLRVSNAQTFTITTAPPLVASFTSPGEGSPVSGTVSVGMSESGANGTPIAFTLTIDGAQAFTVSGAATTATFSWNTAGYAAGSHTLGLTVRDGAGRTATATRNVTVASSGTLRVAITQPGADGATASGVAWFVLWVDGAAVGTKTYTLSVGGATVATTNDTASGPISLPWDTRAVSDGSITVIAGARDASGNTGAAARVVSVQNGQQPLVASFTSPPEGATVNGMVTLGMAETGATGTPIVFTLTVDGAQVFTASGVATTASFNWSANSVADGPHTLGLTVRDGAGRTATATRNVTVTPPPPPPPLTASITSPAEGATVTGMVSVGLSETNGTGTITWTLRLDGGATPIFTTSGTAATASFNWDASAVTPGAHRLDLTVQDGGGRTATATRNVTVAAPPPLTASFTSPAEGATVTGMVSVGLSETNGTGTITWTLRLDGGATPIFTTSGTATTASFNWDTSTLTPGAHRLDLTVQDGGGRTATATRNVTVAAPPPLTASFMSPAEGATVSGPVVVGMSETGGTGTVTWTLRLDSGATPIFTTSGTATTASFNWDTSTVAPGAHRLDLTVQDGAGRTATATHNVTVQQIGTIRVFITQPAEGATVSGTVWFTIWLENAAAGAKTLTLSIDGVTMATTSSTSNGPVSMPWTASSATNGPHTATVSVRDTAGNTGSAVRNLTVTGGSGPAPLVASFTSPAEGASVSGLVTIGMSETGASGTPIVFTLTVDGAQVFTTSGAAATASFSWNSNSVADGPHALGLTVQDGTGRTATATRNVTVTTPPPPPPLTASITSPTEGATVTGTVMVAMSETGGTGTISWTLRLDGGATPIFTTSGSATTASFSWDTSAVAPGAHQLVLTVQDGGGRTATATRNVTVPAPPPLMLSFTGPAEGATVGGAVGVSLSATGGSGTHTWTVRADGAQIFAGAGPATTATFNWDTTTVADGPHTLTATVQDGAGRTATATRNVSVQQPTGSPISVFITAPGEGATVSGTVWFTIWIDKAAAGSKTYTLSVGGTVVGTTTTTSNGPVSMPWTSTGTPNGSRQATVTVRDSVGASGSATRTVNLQN